ncbi:hypothetical protein JCM10449v2_006721 [Rhodotorula kratochvilovae]
MSKRTAKQRASYVEVDSDADLASSDNELMRSGDGDDVADTAREGVGSSSRGKGDTYGAHKPVKKKARKSSTAKDKGKGQDRKKGSLDVKRFLDLPYDMLAEVCTHLGLADLVHLASTSRALRKLLLGKSGAQLWGLVRRENGYVLPDGMTEIEFALLLEGKRCQNCGTKTRVEKLYRLRVRLCSDCKKQVTIKHDRFLRDALDEMNDRLQDLEDEDAQARAKNKRFLWTTESRRLSQLGNNPDPERDDHVRRFVEAERARLLKKSTQLGQALEHQKKLRERG